MLNFFKRLNLWGEIMGFAEDYMMKLNNCKSITVLEGDGEFLDFETNEIYRIHSIKLPFTSSGKHITVYSNEEGMEDIVMDMSYLDGKILSFILNKVEHWKAL